MWTKHEASKNTGTARTPEKNQFCGCFVTKRAVFCKLNYLAEHTDPRSGQVETDQKITTVMQIAVNYLLQ